MDDIQNDGKGDDDINAVAPTDGVIDTNSDPNSGAKSAIVSNVVDLKKCPCGGSISCFYVCCDVCSQEWHQDCVFLSGLNKIAIKSLKYFACPFCSYLPKNVEKRENVDKPGLPEISSVIRQEVSSIIPGVVEQITKAVKENIASVQAEEVVKKANDEISRSWATITAGKQRQLITEVVQESSNVALSKSMQLTATSPNRESDLETL